MCFNKNIKIITNSCSLLFIKEPKLFMPALSVGSRRVEQQKLYHSWGNNGRWRKSFGRLFSLRRIMRWRRERCFLLVRSMAHFFTKSHKIHLTGSTGEGRSMQAEKPPNWVKGKECWVVIPGNEKQQWGCNELQSLCLKDNFKAENWHSSERHFGSCQDSSVMMAFR